MRILLISTSYPRHPGDPTGHFVETEATELARAGHEVHVVAPGRVEPSPRHPTRQEGVATVWTAGGESLFGPPGALIRARENPLRLFDLAHFLPAVVKIMRALEPIDRTIAHFVVPSGYPLALATSGSLEVVLHGSDARLCIALPAPLRRHIVRRLLRRGAVFRFVAESLRRDFLESLDDGERELVRRASRVLLPRITVPAANAALLARCRGIRGEAYLARWVSCGRLIASKRVDLAIREAAKRRAHLTVVGDGPMRAELESLAATFEPRAHFVGQVSRDEALAWIAGAHKLVHLSAAEGAPTVVREARALGVPVLATEVGDVGRWAAEDPGIEIYRGV